MELECFGPHLCQWSQHSCQCLCFGLNLFYYNFLAAFWVFIAAHWFFSSCDELGLLPNCGVPASHCGGFFSCGAQASIVAACGLSSTGSVVVARGFSYSAACGIFPDQGLNLCPLHWWVDS